MDRLLVMDEEQFIARMQTEFRQAMRQVAEAVNNAPTGNVLNASEMVVRDVMAEFRRKAYETAMQMRIDSTESSFSPSEGRAGQPQAEQGSQQSQHAERERADRVDAGPLVRRRRRQ